MGNPDDQWCHLATFRLYQQVESVLAVDAEGDLGAEGEGVEGEDSKVIPVSCYCTRAIIW